MPIALKPCPFCGGEASWSTNEIDFVPWPMICCDECSVTMDAREGDGEELIAQHWNTRQT